MCKIDYASIAIPPSLINVNNLDMFFIAKLKGQCSDQEINNSFPKIHQTECPSLMFNTGCFKNVLRIPSL